MLRDKSYLISEAHDPISWVTFGAKMMKPQLLSTALLCGALGAALTRVTTFLTWQAHFEEQLEVEAQQAAQALAQEEQRGESLRRQMGVLKDLHDQATAPPARRATFPAPGVPPPSGWIAVGWPSASASS